MKAESKATWSLVCRPQDVAHVSNNKALLVGSSVFASSRDILLPGYSKLAPRHGAGMLAAFFTKHSPRVYVGVSDLVIHQAPRGVRFALAIDGYLQWGLRSKGKVILIGGFDSETESSLDVLIFEDGRFVDYANKVLPGTSANHYSETVTDLLDEFGSSHPEHKIIQAAPLTPFGEAFPKVKYLGDKPFRRLSFGPLSQKPSSGLNNLAFPIGIVALAAAVYIGAVAKGWVNFQASKATFAREIADPLVRGKGGVDSALIDVTQQRRFFMNGPRRQVALAEKSGALVAGIGKIPGLRIVEVTLTTPETVEPATSTSSSGGETASAMERKPDVLLRVSVPTGREGALAQGKTVMQAISANTGMSARLAHQGWADDGKRRVFNIEGFING